MGKSCHTFDHTADVGLEARADSARELLEALAEGLAEFICPRSRVTARETRRVRVAAPDLESLTLDLLAGTLNVIQADRFMVASAAVSELSDNHVAAELAGEPYDPSRHEIHTEVKAVTYYMLKVGRDGDQWLGRVVLDL